MARKNLPRKIGAPDKRRRPRGLTKAIRGVIEDIVFNGRTRDEACGNAGISTRAWYLALKKSEVVEAYNEALQMLRAGERAANLRRLIELRDQGKNANAAVKATLALIEMDAEAGEARTGDSSPGVVIMIGSEKRGVTIEGRPALPDPTRPTRPANYQIEPPPPPPVDPIFRPRK